MATKSTLFTGFPGFLGARLIPKLLAADPEGQIIALVEPSMVARAEASARELGIDDRLVILRGDITQPNFGLAGDRYAQLTQETTSVFHLAAIYNLAVPEKIAEKVNVVGTRHVVEFCRAATALERFNYISTAYVAGKRNGMVLESELDVGQGFRNHYESTKFAAEVLVREAMGEVPTTIYRPGIVVGDSHTGETQKFDGPYYLLRVISTLAKLHMPIFRPGKMNVPFNVVPVDYIVDAIAVGSRLAEAEGETFHLVDPRPVLARELYELMANTYVGKRRSGANPKVLPSPFLVADLGLRVGLVRKMLAGTPHESLHYLTHEVRHDTTRAQEVLGAAGVVCPAVDSYVPAMVEFFRSHEDDESYQPA